MFSRSYLFATSIVSVLAAQPSAPKPYAAPLRDLKFGQLNFLHTTDTHGWHAGHLLEPSYSADWGDYIDFSNRLREKVEADGTDLLVIDTGDRVEGNGLYDASEPKGKYTFNIFDKQHIDVICSGNHELYKQNTSDNEYRVVVPAYENNYLASNLDILDPKTGEYKPLSRRYKKFTTKKQGIRIVAFGFIYDFLSNANNTRIQRVEDTVKESWFREAIRDNDVDLFLVIGHAAVRSPEFTAIYKAIRSAQWDTPIQFFGGHYHIRDYHRFDSKSYGLASGRFMETVGFQSIDGLSTGGKPTQASRSPSFFRRYIDNNLFSYYHHSGHNASTFHSKHGQRVSKAIRKARKALDLDQTFGCADKDLWMNRAQYPSNNSIYTWLEEQVLPDIVNDTRRADIPRLVLTNTGAIRFDIFKGAFTKDSTFIISPFTSGLHYIRDVPFTKAKQLLGLLNAGGDFVQAADLGLPLWQLSPPEQQGRSSQAHLDGPHSHYARDQLPMSMYSDLQPGYTTRDDAGSDGDDTLHAPITFYNVPNCIQTIINPQNEDLEKENVDLVYNEFIQPWILLALKFLGLDYGMADVEPYMPDENFTTLLAKWITTNWKDNC